MVHRTVSVSRDLFELSTLSRFPNIIDGAAAPTSIAWEMGLTWLRALLRVSTADEGCQYDKTKDHHFFSKFDLFF